MSRAARLVAAGWLAVAVVAVLALVWHSMIFAGDTFWCLAAGDRVLDGGALPQTDPFTFTAADRPWLLHMPAYQIGSAWVMRHLGAQALLALATLVYSAARVLVWLSFARTPTARLLTFPLVLLAIQVESADICVRGQVVGDLTFALLLLLLRRIQRGGSAPFYLPLLLGTAWVNVHPSALLGIVLPLAMLAVERADPPSERGDARTYLRTSALLAAGTLANPYGLALLVDIARLSGNPTTALIDLFNSPDFHDPGWTALLVATVVFLGARALAGGRNVRSDILVAAAFFAATCRARRFGSFLTAFEIAVTGQLLSERGDLLRERTRDLLRGATALLSVLGTVLVAREPSLPFRDVPVGAARFVDEQGLRGNVVDVYEWGGYLDWAWQGRRKIAIDGRNQLFDDGTFDDMSTLARLGPWWGSILDMYEADVVLWESGAPLDRALTQLPEWQEVYRDRLAVVYRRR